MMRPQLFFSHAGEIVAGEADAAENVDLEEAEPIGVGNLCEGFDLEGSQVIDQDVCLRHSLGEKFDSAGGAQIGGDTLEVCRFVVLADFF